MARLKNIYEENGFKNRNEYLSSLAEEYSVDEHIVFEVADLLGDNEDFDGLVMELKDYGIY